MIKALDHFALSVSNLEASTEFYCQNMGLSLVRVIECPPEMRLGEVAGMPGCSARIAHLRYGETMLELFEYRSPKGDVIPPKRKQADLGFIHMGFTSTDARADYETLASKGVRFVGQPLEFRPGVWIVYFYGPDGEVCELREAPD